MSKLKNATLLDQVRRLLEEEGPGLQELRDRIRELEDEKERRENREMSSWMIHQVLPKDYHPELPVPRLQIEVMNHEYGTRYIYSMVYRHHLEHLIAVPLGYTRSSGGWPRTPKEKIRAPGRDGFHMAADSKHLKLPAFLIEGERAEVFDVDAWTPGGAARAGSVP